MCEDFFVNVYKIGLKRNEQILHFVELRIMLSRLHIWQYIEEN